MVITSIHAAVYGLPTPYPIWSLHRFENCSDPSIATFYVPSQNAQGSVANEDMTFPSGLVIPTDGKLYVSTSSGDMAVWFSAFGYLVASNSVRSSATRLPVG